MSALRDLHVHTVFCDGNDTPEEMVLSAIDKGLDCLGICAHSFVAFDPGYCMAPERYAEFQTEIARLKAKYRGKIDLLCGIEQDCFSRIEPVGFDYVIGSVHYLKTAGAYVHVDDTPALFTDGCTDHFGGDYYALAEQYYETVSHVVEMTGCDIIAHFDLLTKFNSDDALFDTDDPRYIRAWQDAVDRLIPFGKPFEINTGAITRKYRKEPYPAKPILDYILEKGGRTILSSDAHRKEDIAFMFSDLTKLR